MSEQKTQMQIPEVHSFDQIAELAREKAKSKKLRAALVCPQDEKTIKGFARAASEGLFAPVIIGSDVAFQTFLEVADLNDSNAVFAGHDNLEAALLVASSMANKGELDLIFNGSQPNDTFVRQLFAESHEFVKAGTFISHIAVIKAKLYPKLLLLSDAGVTIKPDIKTKIALVNNLSSFGSRLGITPVRIAVLAAVEAVYPQMTSTLDGAVLSKMAERRQIKNVLIDGPLSFDIAVDRFAAEGKGIKNLEVAGQADALLAPNIETANGIYTAMSLYGSAEVGGLLYGGRVPIAMASRSDSENNRYHSILLAIVAAG